MNCELVYIGKCREIQRSLCESRKGIDLGLFFMYSNTVLHRSFTRIVKLTGVRTRMRKCMCGGNNSAATWCEYNRLQSNICGVL